MSTTKKDKKVFTVSKVDRKRKSITLEPYKPKKKAAKKKAAPRKKSVKPNPYIGLIGSINRMVESMVAMGHEGDIVMVVPLRTYIMLYAEVATTSELDYQSEYANQEKHTMGLPDIVLYGVCGRVVFRLEQGK